jgi:hypothetical protein
MCLFMNILIEKDESLEYFTDTNQWSKNAADGKDFESAKAAFAVAKKEPIGKFNIVAYIRETKQFINMDHGRGRGIPEISPALADTPAAHA